MSYSSSSKQPVRTALAALLGLSVAAISPMALAGGHGHGRYHGYHGYGHGYGHAGPARHGYVNTYRGPGRHDYYGYRRHHWHAGEVIGAVVAGAVLTSVIADAFEPHTTVVERRVYRDDDYYREAYDYPETRTRVYETRYIGPDDGYYDSRRR